MDIRIFSFLALVHQHLVMVERGSTSPAQSSGISVYLGPAIRQEISKIRQEPSVCTHAMVLNYLAYPLCAAWSRPGHPRWVLQIIPLAMVASQRWKLWSLRKACPRKMTERGLILSSLAVNLHFPKTFKSHWKHKGKAAENCWLLSDCRLKIPSCIQEGKYCSLQAYGYHQPRDELRGEAISCFTDECS